MTTRRKLTLADFTDKPISYNKFGEKVTRNPIERIYDAGYLINYKQLSTEAKYLRFRGMQEDNDGGEGIYFRDDSITDEEDIGVIIYIGEYKYRRLYHAWVNIDWFYIDDFAVALQRAIKYSSIRGTAGKTYECKTSINLQLTPITIGNHGFIDNGHKLIDLRGATVNFTNTEENFCFNIRLYHNELKFMLTNGIWNVTEQNIGLINIANIIGGNEYTDMLTDMVYNVDKNKQPDTNRVVLVDDVTMKATKVFNNIKYTGNLLSSGDTNAVSKNYISYNYNIMDYVLLNDDRLIPSITTFSDILDIGDNNLVNNNNSLTALVYDSVVNTLQDIVRNIYVNTYVNNMYIPSIDRIPDDIFGVNTVIKRYISNNEYSIYKITANNIIIKPQSYYNISEAAIDIPIYIKFNMSEPVYIDKNDITEVDDESAKMVIDSSAVDTSDYVNFIYALKAPADNASLQCNTIIKGNFNKNIFGDITQAYAVYFNRGYGIVYNEPNTNIYKIYYGFTSYDRAIFNNDTILVTNCTLLIRDTFYITGHFREVYTINKINYINSFNTKVLKVNNFPIQIQSINIIGLEYIKLIQPEFYIKEYTEQDNLIKISTFYLRYITPIQANLKAFKTINDITYSAGISFVFKYNRDIIYTTYTYLYIARYISNGIPRLEYYNIELYTNSAADSIRYTYNDVIINNTLSDLQLYLFIYKEVYEPNFNLPMESDVVLHKYEERQIISHTMAESKGKCATDANCYDTAYSEYGNLVIVSFDIITNKHNANVLGSNKLIQGYNRTAITDTNVIRNFASLSGYDCGSLTLTSSMLGSLYFDVIIDKRYGVDINGIFNHFKPGTYINIKPNTYSAQCCLFSPSFFVTKPRWYGFSELPTYAKYTNVTKQWNTVKKYIYCGNLRHQDIQQDYGMIVSKTCFSAFRYLPKLYNRIFGNKIMYTSYVIRDGILKDPFRDRTQRSDHIYAAPVGVFDP